MKQTKNQEGTEALCIQYVVTPDEVGRELEILCTVNIPICRGLDVGFKKLFHPSTGGRFDLIYLRTLFSGAHEQAC